MGATVQVPGVGPVKRQYVIVGASVTVGVVGWAWLRRSSDPAVTDPAAEALPADEFSDTGDVAPVGGSGYIGGGSSGQPATTDGDGTDRITTNAQWSAAAVEGLIGLGYDGQRVAEVLGKFLSGLPIPTGDVAVILAARAVVGPEPVAMQIKTIRTPPKGGGITIPKKPKPPIGKPKPKPTPTGGQSVTVVKWTPRNTPWQSTLSGIARHYGKSTTKVWMAPQNAQLRKSRKIPSRIQPGDRVFVPAA